MLHFTIFARRSTYIIQQQKRYYGVGWQRIHRKSGQQLDLLSSLDV